MLKKSISPGWKGLEFGKLKFPTIIFKDRAKAVLGPNKASDISTLVWHAQNHVADALKQVRGMEYLDAGLFETSDKGFEKKYS